MGQNRLGRCVNWGGAVMLPVRLQARMTENAMTLYEEGKGVWSPAYL